MKLAVILGSVGAWVRVLYCIPLLANLPSATGHKLPFKWRLFHVLWGVSGTFGYSLDSWRRMTSSIKLTTVIWARSLSKINVQYNTTYPNARYPDRQLSGSASPFGEICREFCKTKLPWNYRLSDQVQYSVTASRTSNQACSKGL